MKKICVLAVSLIVLLPGTAMGAPGEPITFFRPGLEGKAQVKVWPNGDSQSSDLQLGLIYPLIVRNMKYGLLQTYWDDLGQFCRHPLYVKRFYLVHVDNGSCRSAEKVAKRVLRGKKNPGFDCAKKRKQTICENDSTDTTIEISQTGNDREHIQEVLDIAVTYCGTHHAYLSQITFYSRTADACDGVDAIGWESNENYTISQKAGSSSCNDIDYLTIECRTSSGCVIGVHAGDNRPSWKYLPGKWAILVKDVMPGCQS